MEPPRTPGSHTLHDRRVSRAGCWVQRGWVFVADAAGLLVGTRDESIAAFVSKRAVVEDAVCKTHCMGAK